MNTDSTDNSLSNDTSRGVSLPGYNIGKRLYFSGTTRVYRAVRVQDQQPVILKILNPECTRLVESSYYKKEHDILKLLHDSGAIRSYCLESYEGAPVLVVDDMGGAPLNHLLVTWNCAGTETFPLSAFFMLARTIVEKVAQLHSLGVIHKDINPSHIVFNPDNHEVRLIDFGLATTLSREAPELKSPKVLEGTLAYMSPEQTGRMNRTVDYRTDFYSMGVTFYELLTGWLPFEAADAVELVHCHLAKTPVSPHALNPAVPVVLAKLVMKLMAKAPEDRYQSAGGILHDLSQCERFFSSRKSVPDFEIGQQDRAGHVMISEKLYGRSGEVQSLLEAFERASTGGTELMLVTGLSGIGKTAVINEIHKPIVKQRGYFIRGKFDQFNRGIPFHGFVQAFRNLVEQLLSESEAEQAAWRDKLLSVLGENGQVIIDMIPDLERLIGPQPDAPELSGSATQNRFNLLFRKFISVFTVREHPLVIFLDDLQWADSVSLQLIQVLISDRTPGYLLLLGAYRDNEVSPAHPLAMTLENIRKNGAGFSAVTLTPLKQGDINQWVADTLDCPASLALPLAQLVYQKTRGNPFFCHQFLKALYSKGLLAFDQTKGCWLCDLSEVGVLALSEDVVEFMAAQLQILPRETQETLKLAACIGNQFDLATLAVVRQQSQSGVAREIWPAVKEGLIFPHHSVLRFNPEKETDGLAFGFDGIQAPIYRFLHDRVQQAAYSLIPEEQRQYAHLHIGQLLLNSTSVEDRENMQFEILNQLNKGASLLDKDSDRRNLAQLNLDAGLKAKSATAHDAAWDYFTAGRNLLPQDAWEKEYALTLKLYESSVESAYLCGNLEAMEDLAGKVFGHARTITDTVKVHEVKIQALANRNNLKEAIEAGLQVLKHLEVNFPEKPDLEDIMSALQETQALCLKKGVHHLIGLPVMTDPNRLMAIRILSQIIPVSYIAAPELYVPLVCKAAMLCVTYGNTPNSSHIYAAYGILLLGVARDIETAYQFGQLALDVMERLDARDMQCRVNLLVYAFIAHWKKPVKDSILPLQAAYYKGLETGDLEFAGYSAMLFCATTYFTGLEKELPLIGKEASSLSESIFQLKQMTAYNYFQMLLQALHDLREENPGSLYLKGTYYDEETMLPVHVKANDRVGLFLLFTHKLILSYLAGDFEQACVNASKAELYLDATTGFPMVPVYYFFYSLARLSVLRGSENGCKSEVMQRVDASQEKMKTWAQHAPVNCAHRFYLVEAERVGMCGEKAKAMDLYDRAIKEARVNGYIRDEALASELAALFYLHWNKDKVARVYLQDAYEVYARWGAVSKVKQLERRYAHLLSPQLNPPVKTGGGHVAVKSMADKVSPSIDLLSVVKASQAIAGEIELERLLRHMMGIVIENAGAQYGALILDHAGTWLIQAQGNANGEISVLQGVALSESGSVSGRIVSDVAQTRTGIVLDDATREGDYIHDPHIIMNKVKSVICAPLVNRGELSGIVYLENNLAAHAFTAERLEMINLLSTQMALSLDNARLYRHVREEHQRIKNILDKLATPIMISRVSDGKVFYANPSLTQVVRVPMDEFIGRKTSEFLKNPESRDPMIEQIKREGQIRDYEIQLLGGDGELYWALVSARLIDYQDETCLLTSCVDITGRKQVESEVRRLNEALELQIAERSENLRLIKEREEFLNAVIENIPHMIFIKDAKDLRFVRVNKAGEELLGISREDLAGKSDYDFFTKEEADFLTTKDRNTLERGEPLDIPEEVIKTRTLGLRILRTKKIPIMNADGDPLFLLGISEDITQKLDSERIEKELKDQLRQAQKLESLGTLAGGIAHDFNNILSAIIGFSELARASLLKGSEAELGLLEVLRASSRAAELVRQILAFSRRTESELIQIDLKAIVKEALGLLRSSIPSSIEIKEHLENGFILGDPTQIHQVVMNLCTNAYHAMRENGGVLKIDLSAVDVDEQYALSHPDLTPGPAMKLSVSDTGHGIDGTTLERIFEPYYTTKEKGDGTGLGLSVVHGIVKKHSGAILVESRVNQGSVFTVYFPRTDQANDDLVLTEKSHLPTGTEKILFVDDEEVLVNVCQKLMEKLGYRVTATSDSLKALELFKEQASSFDLVISDMTMPKMTGDKLVREIMAIRNDIPVILCTGYSDQITKEKAEALGIQEFFYKPIIFEQLAKTMRKVLDRAKG